MCEDARQHLVDQEMLERARWKQRIGTTRDRAIVIDEERRKPREAETVGVAVAGARQDDVAVRRSPVVIPARIGEFGSIGGGDPNPAGSGAAYGLGKGQERELAFEHDIREPVEHVYGRGFFPLEPSFELPEPPVVRSFSVP